MTSSRGISKYAGDIPVMELTMVRAILSTIFTYFAARYFKIKHFFGEPKVRVLVLIRGFLGAIGQLCLLFAIRFIPIADVHSINFLYEVLVLPIGVYFFKEHASYLSFIGGIFAIGGGIIGQEPPFITGRTSAITKPKLIGVSIALASAVNQAVLYTIVHQIGKRENALIINLYVYIFTFILAVISFFSGFPQSFIIPSLWQWCIMICFTALAATSQIIQGHGVQIGNLALTSTANYTQVIYGYLIDIVLFHHQPSAINIFGAVLIALGIYCMSSDKESSREQKSHLDEEQQGLHRQHILYHKNLKYVQSQAAQQSEINDDDQLNRNLLQDQNVDEDNINSHIKGNQQQNV